MRNITDDVRVELEAGQVRPLFLVSIQFANETLYMWTGVGDLVWNGNTYKGMGTLGTVSTIAETGETQAQGITLTLSGIPTPLLIDSMTQMTSDGTASVYLGFLHQDGSIVADPILAYSGLTDQPTIDMSTETCNVSIAVENRLSDLNRARGGRYTDQDQRQRHPADTSLKYVNWLSDQFVNWRGKN
jgi:hypothetical protein